MMAEMIGALIASVYGSLTALRPKTPLFYRIVFFAMLTCLMGNVYTVLYGLLWGAGEGSFHVGYLGYAGMFFFLYSSYYGAINSLADSGQKEYGRFRTAAGAAAAVFLAGAIWLARLSDRALWMGIVIVPMSLTVYFSVKHLLIPDVERGIIRVMRPYNSVMIALCVCMMLRLLSRPGTAMEAAGGVGAGLLLAVCLPVLRNGVRKWSI